MTDYRDIVGLGMARGIQFSDRLVQLMQELTPLQRRAIPKIILHLWEEGGALTHLLRTPENKGPHTICAWNTWYKRGGWQDDEAFQEALELAKVEYTEAMLGQAVPKTVEEIRRAGPRIGRQINEFLNQLDDAQLFGVLLRLVESGQEADGQARVVMGMLREWGRLRDSVLDRLDVATGVKESGSGGEAQRLRDYLEALRKVEEGEA